MKKLHIFLVSLLVGFVFINASVVSVNAQSTNPGAATLNDLQGQAGGSYQNNGLNQDVGNVSTGGASGAANLLRGDSQQSSLIVVGAPVNQATNTTSDKLSTGWIIFGSILLFVLIAPLIVLYKNSVDSKLAKEETKRDAGATKEKSVKTEKTEEPEIKVDTQPVKTKSKSKKSKNVNKAKRGKKKKK